jgi:hypothetical protein
MKSPEELFSAFENLSDNERFAHAFHPIEYRYIVVRPHRLGCCGATADALMNVTLGNSPSQEKIALSGLELDVLRAGERIGPDKICTYRILFNLKTQRIGSPNQRNIDHGFCVVMYEDKNHEMRYRLFQSYVHHYSLSEFIENARRGLIKNDFSHEDFMEFIEKLNEFSQAKLWSHEIEAFYRQYFGIKTTREGAEICTTADGDDFRFDITRAYCSLNKIEIRTPKETDFIFFYGWDDQTEKDPLMLKAIKILISAPSLSFSSPGFMLVIEASSAKMLDKYADLKYKPILDALLNLQKQSSISQNIEVDVLNARALLEKAIDAISVSHARTDHLFASIYKPAGSVDSTTSKEKKKSTVEFF